MARNAAMAVVLVLTLIFACGMYLNSWRSNFDKLVKFRLLEVVFVAFDAAHSRP
jgi:succinate-acetate transporter protein